ncbi:hypothetical protein GCM10018785_53730 [Streptomyces longispororuber]|uniref:Uncharacterized protein n=1 Tax=Streptomyces longispororuber TaxID=68230 RepID=A0A919A016_9ACTN|nr:hypothetical protein GCM10018785_53730 [Streptomyces longispororuber]
MSDLDPIDSLLIPAPHRDRTTPHPLRPALGAPPRTERPVPPARRTRPS